MRIIMMIKIMTNMMMVRAMRNIMMTEMTTMTMFILPISMLTIITDLSSLCRCGDCLGLVGVGTDLKVKRGAVNAILNKLSQAASAFSLYPNDQQELPSCHNFLTLIQSYFSREILIFMKF